MVRIRPISILRFKVKTLSTKKIHVLIIPLTRAHFVYPQQTSCREDAYNIILITERLVNKISYTYIRLQIAVIAKRTADRVRVYKKKNKTISTTTFRKRKRKRKKLSRDDVQNPAYIIPTNFSHQVHAKYCIHRTVHIVYYREKRSR